MNKVKLQDLEKVLEPLFYHWKRRRQSKESFGDFTTRMVSSKATKILYLLFLGLLVGLVVSNFCGKFKVFIFLVNGQVIDVECNCSLSGI